MQQSGESPNLDLLRSVAVLSVLADHAGGTVGIAQRHPFFWALGRWGVLLFFVHTCLVLMMSMGRQELSGVPLHATFYIRRFFRIYPLSILVVGIVIAAHIPSISWNDGSVDPVPDLKAIISNFLLCQTLVPRPSVTAPLWSLPYEVQMYLLLPALFLFVRKTRLRTLAGLWLGAVVLGSAQGWLADTDQGILWDVHDRLRILEFLPCFLMGVIAYHLLRTRRKTGLPFWIWAATLCVVTAVYLRWNARVGFVGYPEWICCLVIGLVVVYCAESGSRWLNFLTHHIAKYSYGLYLAQVPVLWLVFVKLKYLPHYTKGGLFLLLIVAVPIASYHLIEHPFIKLGGAIGARASELTTRKWGRPLPAAELWSSAGSAPSCVPEPPGAPLPSSSSFRFGSNPESGVDGSGDSL
jgi:peptidoglycan/LPS O-acetylase OafA/YrhL